MSTFSLADQWKWSPGLKTSVSGKHLQTDEWRQRWGLHTGEALRVRALEMGASDYVIEGLIPSRSISILLGDSGLGKSALMYQAAVCVAEGLPFLGCPTTKGRVVIADFENGVGDMYEMVERLSGYLGLQDCPSDLLLWSPYIRAQQHGQNENTLLAMLRDVAPSLAIVDSLGSYAPEAESKNPLATRMLTDFRRVANECKTATALVHHRRKQPRNAEESAGPIEKANIRNWFQEARGASSLVNGSDVRLGVDEPDVSSAAKDDVSLVLRGFGRVRGEIGPIYVARDMDENGDPVGYRRLTGPELLFNEQQQRVLVSLGQEFTTKEAKSALGRAYQPTANFLQRCTSLSLIRRLGRGHWEKLLPPNGVVGGVYVEPI